jgi:hypothetical protein
MAKNNAFLTTNPILNMVEEYEEEEPVYDSDLDPDYKEESNSSSSDMDGINGGGQTSLAQSKK